MIKNISKHYAVLLISAVLFTSFSCSKKYMSGTIYMGSGGGFAGNWREYQLNTNGDLYFLESRKDSIVFVKTLDSAATKKVFKKYYKLKLESNDLDAPGNMYQYIGRRDGKFRNHKITFGHPEANEAAKDLKEYFTEFMANVGDSTFSNRRKK
jgi:hypothetical protein